jgi:hypothetical protein
VTKFRGTYQDLQHRISLTGIAGEWEDHGIHKQYRADSGAIINYWETTGTIDFSQGRYSKEFEQACLRAIGGDGQQCASSRKRKPVKTSRGDGVLERVASKVMNARKFVTREWRENTIKRISIALMIGGNLNGYEMGVLDSIEEKLMKKGTEAVLTDKQMVQLTRIFDKAGC